MSNHCPTCNGVIYNRRCKTCGYCGAELPAQLLFTAAEIEAIDKEAAVLAAFHQKQKAEIELEDLKRQLARQQPSVFSTSYFFGKL